MSSEVPTVNARLASQWLLRQGHRLPYHREFSRLERTGPGRHDFVEHDDFTEQQWEDFPYETAGGEFQEPDPDADPKPTWETILRAARLQYLQNTGETYFDLSPYVAVSANAAVSHRHAGAPVDVGGGMDHLTAILLHAQEAKAAGRKWPLVIMRDTSGELLTLHTEREGSEVLNPTAAQKNRASNAGNMVRAELEKLRAVALDPNGKLRPDAPEEAKLGAREVAAEKFQAMLKDLTPHFETALARVDRLDASPEALPATYPLERVKEILIDEWEDAVNDKLADILNIAAQKGMDLPGSCDDQSAALTAVSRTKQEHQILIARADDHDDAKLKLREALAALKAITPGNTPHWYGDGGGRITDGTLAIAGSSGFIQARSPLEGKVSGTATVIAFDDATPANPNAVARLAKTGDNLSFFLGVTEGTAPAKFEIEARSICGPSRIIVTLTPPTS